MKRQSASLRPQPFFEKPDERASVRRRLLLISFYFPPAQASGSLRWQKLSHYVAERGWALDVITLDPSCLDSPDSERLADLASGIRVFGVPRPTLRIDETVQTIWRICRRLLSQLRRNRSTISAEHDPPSGRSGRARSGSVSRSEVRWALNSPRGFIRVYAAWRDHAVSGRWARSAAALAQRIIEPSVHHAIITSGPPHMVHDAGRRLSRKTGLPFIMDMRDPWSLSERLLEDVASPAWLFLASRYERRAVAEAAIVVTNTEPFRLAMCQTYPSASDRIITVMNGCDEGALPTTPRDADRFIIAYAGAIYIDRDPRILFRAVARVIRELALTPADLGIEFIGQVDEYEGVPVTQIAREEGLSGFVAVGPMRPHRAALEFLARATMLVSLPQDNDLAIPAKIFDYARFNAWVLALATRESATGRLLSGSGADVIDPDDLHGMVTVLRERFHQHRHGITPMPLATDGRFSRRAQAQLFLEAIAKCTRRDAAGQTNAAASLA